MFDPLVAERVAADVRLLSELDLSTCSTAEVEQLVRTSQACTQTLAGVQARAGAEFEARGGPEQAGCSTLGAWLRRELRLSPAQALRARRAGSALRQLPLVRQALTAGSITMEHVDVFADATRRIGVPVVRDAQQLLLGVAVHSDTRDLRTAVDRLRDAVDPDAADRDWANAQEKQDLTCHRVGSGWQVAGWLSVETGAKLRVLLDSFGKPAHAEDDRPVARRRVDALDALLDDILAGGLPTDHGFRPHLNVTVDADTLAAAFGAATSSGHTSGAGDGSTRPGATRPAATRPATLAGYGAIGRDLLTMLACDSTITVALTDGHTDQHPGIRTGIGPPHRHQPDVHPPGTNPPGGLSGDSPPGAGPPGADRWELGRHHCGCPTTPYRHVLDVGRSERIATAR